MPDPAEPATEALNLSQQRLSSLTQAGWQVDYTGYAGTDGQALPVRLTLRREAVRVRMLVDEWQP